MKKSLKLISFSLLLAITTSCSISTPLGENKNENIIKNNLTKNQGMLKLTAFENLKNGFGTKAVDFSESTIANVELKVMGGDMLTVSSGKKSYTFGTPLTIEMSVASGKNRVLMLQGFDATGNIISQIMGVMDIESGKTNTGSVSYFDNVIASIVKNLIEMNSTYLTSLSLTDLRTNITTLTGFDKVTNKFTNFDPSMLNTTLIAKTIDTTKAVTISNTLQDVAKTVPVTVTGNKADTKVIITDLATSTAVTDSNFIASFDQVPIGKFKVVMIKQGLRTIVKDLDTTGTGPFNISASFEKIPSLTSLSKDIVKAGDSVIITGENFDPIIANNILFLYFGSDAVSPLITSATTTTLTFTVPKIPNQNTDVTQFIILRSNGQLTDISNIKSIRVLAPEIVISSLVTETPTDTITPVTIEGTNFTGIDKIELFDSTGNKIMGSISLKTSTSFIVNFDRPLATSEDFISVRTLLYKGSTVVSEFTKFPVTITKRSAINTELIGGISGT